MPKQKVTKGRRYGYETPLTTSQASPPTWSPSRTGWAAS